MKPSVTAGQRIQCSACFDVIRSESRHDFRRCKCGKTFVDGGSAYLRFGWDPSIQKPILVGEFSES